MLYHMKASVKRRRGRTRVSPKHQVTIPAVALEEAGLHVGDELEVSVEEGRVVLSRPAEALRRYIGSMPGVWPQGWLDELRAEWRG
jgi:AbrB family looped-hinge helix DNA binding protein